MSGVDSIINFKKDEREDYYRVLGCSEDSTLDQINAEYKIRALLFHPDKNQGDKEAEVKFQILNEAKDVLTDPEKKIVYDKWRNSGIAISYKQWLGMKDAVHQSMHWSTPKTKDRMLPGTGGSSGPSSLGSGGVNPAHRRASEGGANLHYGGRNVSGWTNDSPSDVVNKFRNYEI